MRQVTLDDAYKEACLALGEAIVRERLISEHAETLERRIAELEEQHRADKPLEPSSNGHVEHVTT